jgi:hypothetical protein
MSTGAIVARILTQYSDKGSKAASKDINKLGKSFDSFGKKSAKAFGVAAAGAAGFALKIGKDAVEAAIADQKSQVLLANSLRNTAGASDTAIAGVESYITSLQKQFSVVDDDLRPAMSRLTAVTGSITAAQGLMQTALDVSASSGASLEESVSAIIKGTTGQFKALKQLVPGLSNATIKSKNFGKALEEVNKQTSGAASKRAGTLEYRLQGLKIAFGEVLETLGYALLPVIEKFVKILNDKIIPAIENWVALNKDKLAKSFETALNFAVKLLEVALAFGDWVTNHTTAITVLAAIIASMFVVGKIAAFITALETIIGLYKALRTAAATAAVAEAAATGGSSLPFALAAAAAAAAALAAYAIDVPSSSKGSTVPSGTIPSLDPFKNPTAKMPITGAFWNNWGQTNPNQKPPVVTQDKTLQAFLDALNKNTVATVKNTKSVMDIATENAMKELAARQKALSGSASIAIGGKGSSIYSVRNGQGKIDVNVYAGNVVGSADALIQAVQTGLVATNRRNGGSGRPMSMVL